MAVSENTYVTNLAFLLDYGDGTSPDEIEYEILKLAFQDKESVHYDRSMGGNFMDLEQEPSNIGAGLLFSSNLIEGIYYTNQEKNNNPYIVTGFDDIRIIENNGEDKPYIVQVMWRLLKDLNNEGTVNI